ncbi:MAG: AAA family ATPase, partial [Bacteroidales bacterium]|nr:AAA family ATPase [Bacteroidales bacterium]
LIDALYVKKNIDLYITASNTYLLSSELATLLTGRYIRINLHPFSFGEYVRAFPDEKTPTVCSDNTGIDGFTGGMRAKKYVSITKTSKASATHDLQELVNQKILMRQGSGRRTNDQLSIPD